jgi:sugar lactone lactonase YvrE
VLAILKDHRGLLWIETQGGGLVRWDGRAGRFTTYRHEAARPDSLASDAGVLASSP